MWGFQLLYIPANGWNCWHFQWLILGVQGYLLQILICIFQMIDDVGYFFLSLLVVSVQSFFFVRFLVGMILLRYESSLYILCIYVCFTPFFTYVLQIFPPFLHLAFSLIVSFDKWKFWFWWSLINQIFHLWLMIMSNLINLCQIQSHKDFLLFSSKSVMAFSLIFTYITYFESFFNV